MDVSTEAVVNRNLEKPNLEKTPNFVFLGVIGLVFLIALGFWIKQFAGGFSGYSAQYAWSLYIAAFFTAVAGGAGAMILATVANISNIIDGVKAKQIYAASIAMFVMGGFFIMADLGAPLNVFKLVFTSNFFAPMVFDFWLLAACVMVCLLAVFMKTQSNSLAILGLVVAVALLVVESWMVAAANVQQLWGVTLGGGIAFIQVAIMAFALLMLIGQDTKFVKVGLTIALVFFLVVSLVELIAGISDGGRLGLQWAAVAGSGVFWTGIIAGCAVPLGLLFMAKEPAKNITRGISVLAMLGVMLTKLSYVWSSQAVPAIETGNLTAPGLHFEEVIIVLGFTALGILVYYGLNISKGGVQS